MISNIIPNSGKLIETGICGTIFECDIKNVIRFFADGYYFYIFATHKKCADAHECSCKNFIVQLK